MDITTNWGCMRKRKKYVIGFDNDGYYIFGLNKYQYDEKLNRIANTLSDCIYLINNSTKL